MTDGRVLQTGSPQALFERPEHTFVGYFIGSPGMNILPVDVDDGRLSVRGRVLPVTADRVRALARHDGRYELGIRPELLELAEGSGDSLVPATLERVDDLGNYTVALVSLEGHALTVTASESYAGRPGDPVGLRFPDTGTHLYCNGKLVE